MDKFKTFLSYLISGLMGCTPALIFSFEEIISHNESVDFQKFLEFFKLHEFHNLSFIFFPSMFMLMNFLLTRIKKQKEQLSQEFDYMKLILNSSPDSIVFLNENLEVTFKNNQFKSLFENFSAINKIINLESFAIHMQYFQKEYFLPSIVSEDHPFLLNFRLTEFNGKKNYFISLKDLKNIKDKEKIIEDQKNLMIEKNKLASLGEMAAGIAHEINNPLTIINSNNFLIEKIIEKPVLEKSKLLELTAKTKTQVVRITDIISSLRNLARGHSNTEKEDFHFNQVIEEAIKLARLKDKDKKITFYNELPSDFYVNGHRSEIIQVVLNLFNNSIDAIIEQDTPWIKIKADENNEFLNFYFIDSGPGIKPQILSKIFIPMFTTKEIGTGTGLGLSLSRNFVENNGGFLLYDNSFGNTCFMLSLKPAKQETLKKVA